MAPADGWVQCENLLCLLLQSAASKWPEQNFYLTRNSTYINVPIPLAGWVQSCANLPNQANGGVCTCTYRHTHMVLGWVKTAVSDVIRCGMFS